MFTISGLRHIVPIKKQIVFHFLHNSSCFLQVHKSVVSTGMIRDALEHQDLECDREALELTR